MGGNSLLKERDVPIKLGCEERVCEGIWVELNNVGLEGVCLEGKRGKENGGKDEMEFGEFEFHGLGLGIKRIW
ncbi:hypothetical protein TIFTF001_019588 [Ficus carica]|uniref:Uncharacterized protein n=1 Tax=Ficus carica TaxID=3494 RepID=A0AA88D915_FICCA|nr:hypothetical protein TIFTF001_019588 [Ficus carica]